MALTPEQRADLSVKIRRVLSQSRTQMPGLIEDVDAMVAWTDDFQDSIVQDYKAGVPAAYENVSPKLLYNFFSFVADAKWEATNG